MQLGEKVPLERRRQKEVSVFYRYWLV